MVCTVILTPQEFNPMLYHPYAELRYSTLFYGEFGLNTVEGDSASVYTVFPSPDCDTVLHHIEASTQATVRDNLACLDRKTLLS